MLVQVDSKTAVNPKFVLYISRRDEVGTVDIYITDGYSESRFTVNGSFDEVLAKINKGESL